ncbi:hypothetical protein AVEN_28890-1 [Araneus ventricosus]|uniref:Uncharacterized protein n=1 Tax=Araneus ventricosus TaxID=182803 RepID=A0A4Y2AKN6_ARAVE|nr:hypothetical protein AVEN_28890-1 [Araneus ventricosus]
MAWDQEGLIERLNHLSLFVSKNQTDWDAFTIYAWPIGAQTMKRPDALQQICFWSNTAIAHVMSYLDDQVIRLLAGQDTWNNLGHVWKEKATRTFARERIKLASERMKDSLRFR